MTNSPANEKSASDTNAARIVRVRRIRNSMNFLSLFNACLVFGWAWMRSFYCWDEQYCDPIDGLVSSWKCVVCQADVLVVFALVVSSGLLVVMLLSLYQHELDETPAADSKTPSRFAAVRTAQSIHQSAKVLDKDGPGWWTVAFALLAIGIAAFYILSDNQSYLCLWLWNCG